MEKHVEKIVSSELACEKLKRNIFEEKNILEKKVDLNLTGGANIYSLPGRG